MILTGPEILEQRQAGRLSIEPFNLEQLNPNSYNLRLGSQLAVYVSSFGESNLAEWVAHETSLPVAQLDCRADNKVWRFDIPERGYLLHPGKLYLGSTIERTTSDVFVPMLNGRSSLARLGISIHQTGGFGDVGFKGTWTLELTCVEPVRIYAGIEVCQIQFWECKGDVQLYDGKYSNRDRPVPCKLYEELRTKEKEQ